MTEYPRNFSPVTKLLRNPDNLRLMAQNYWGQNLGTQKDLTMERLTELATPLFAAVGTHRPVLELSGTRSKETNHETGEREGAFIGGVSFFNRVTDFYMSLDDFGDELDGWILERSRSDFRSVKKESHRSIIKYSQYSRGSDLERALDRALILTCCGLELANSVLGPCMVPPRNPDPVTVPGALAGLESRLDALMGLLSRYEWDLSGEKDPARRRGGRALKMLKLRAEKYLKPLCAECMKISDEAERKKKWNSHFEAFCQRCIARVSGKSNAMRRQEGGDPACRSDRNDAAARRRRPSPAER